MQHGRFTAVLMALATFAVQTPAPAQNSIPADSAGEAYLGFQYEGGANTVITALYYENAVFLPVGALFTALQIDHSIDPRARSASGFFIDPERPYRLDLAQGRGHNGEREFTVPDSSYIVSELEVYLLPEVFDTAFGLDFSVNLRDLELALSTSDTLPVVRAARRALGQERIGADPFLKPPAPLRYARQRHLLHGGVLQYGLSFMSSGDRRTLGFDLGTGGELLGGSLQGSIYGYLGNETSALTGSNLHWRYVFDREQRWIREANVGDLTASGLQTYRLQGVQISNKPVALRQRLGTHTIYGTSEPGWEVELHLHGQLVGVTEADAAGNFQFTVPLTYGTTLARLMYYGPTGQVRDEYRRIEIPFEFVPAGELDYTVTAGREARTDRPLLIGDLAFGITDWLTTSAGLQWMEGDGFGPNTVRPFGRSTLRLFGNTLVGVEAAPGSLFSGALQSFIGRQGTVRLTYTDFASDAEINPTGRDHSLELRGFVPARAGSIPINFTVRAEEIGYTDWQTRHLDADVTAVYRGFTPSIGYRLRRGQYAGHTRPLEQQVAARFSYFFGNPPGPLAFARGTLLRGSADFALDHPIHSGLEHVQFDISRPVLGRGRLSVGTRHDFFRGSTELEIGLSFDLPSARSATTLRSAGGNTTFTESLRGTIAFDPQADDWIFRGRPWLGGAGVAVRAFIDANGNGTFDTGEQIIPEVDVRFRQAIPTHRSADGVIRTSDLLAYNRYSVSVDQSSIRNPLWIPKFDSFSFIADPNQFKSIDIPFYVAGELSGKVHRQSGGEPHPVSGLRVHVDQVDGDYGTTLSTFSDGSFYYLGLPPGMYEARVDSAQLEILSATSAPIVRRFEVRTTKMGDIVEGIDFSLEPVLTGSPTTTAPSQADTAEVNARDVVVARIHFRFDEHTLSSRQMGELDRVARMLRRDSSKMIRIAGHTDSIGPDAYNFQLSMKRAQYVADHLVAQGIVPSRIQVTAHGGSCPISTNGTPFGRQANRRADIVWHPVPAQAAGEGALRPPCPPSELQ